MWHATSQCLGMHHPQIQLGKKQLPNLEIDLTSQTGMYVCVVLHLNIDESFLKACQHTVAIVIAFLLEASLS